MELDLGMEVFDLPGGQLRFNPADPALFGRLEQLEEKLFAIQASDPWVFDRQAKQVLNWFFGPGNDVDKALGGISLMAQGSNGKSVLENLLEAFVPVLREGMERCAATC